MLIRIPCDCRDSEGMGRAWESEQYSRYSLCLDRFGKYNIQMIKQLLSITYHLNGLIFGDDLRLSLDMEDDLVL